MVQEKRQEEIRANEKNGNGTWISTLSRALKSRRLWQTFIRCWAVLTVTLVFMVSSKVSTVIGQSSFFCVYAWNFSFYSRFLKCAQDCCALTATITCKFNIHCRRVYDDDWWVLDVLN